jgi:CheY-like chemotaxis protein
MTKSVTAAPHILLVEDNPADADLVAEALAQFTVPPRLSVVPDGEAALRFLGTKHHDRPPDVPDLIILDLNLPKKNGHEVLAAVKADDALRHIPVVIFTSSAAERDRFQAYHDHASCYITKPPDLDAFFHAFRTFEEFWIRVVSLPPPAASSPAA